MTPHSRKIILGILAAMLLFVAAMIDSRGPEIMGTCVVGEYEIRPVANHDCTKGVFYE